MSVSSATVRNEMADLGYLGLLDQPHTSAGRVPTGEGYRYYVDNLVPESELSEESRRLIDAGIGNANGDPESLLRHAGEALAYLTQCAAVMTNAVWREYKDKARRIGSDFTAHRDDSALGEQRYPQKQAVQA